MQISILFPISQFAMPESKAWHCTQSRLSWALCTDSLHILATTLLTAYNYCTTNRTFVLGAGQTVAQQ